MPEFTQEELSISYNTLDSMNIQIQKTLFRLPEGSAQRDLFIPRLRAFTLVLTLIKRELEGEHAGGYEEEELSEALDIIVTNREKLGQLPPQMETCIKCRSATPRQIRALEISEVLINRERVTG